ncbi:MAG: protein jag, partial [Acidobacteria bacterium]|nr:protein jag [Acidobacteriota bacterium]
TLNHMNARERRIVHLALRDLPAVRTESQGFGPERKVVILPASPGRQTPPR